MYDPSSSIITSLHLTYSNPSSDVRYLSLLNGLKKTHPTTAGVYFKTKREINFLQDYFYYPVRLPSELQLYGSVFLLPLFLEQFLRRLFYYPVRLPSELQLYGSVFLFPLFLEQFLIVILITYSLPHITYSIIALPHHTLSFHNKLYRPSFPIPFFPLFHLSLTFPSLLFHLSLTFPSLLFHLSLSFSSLLFLLSLSFSATLFHLSLMFPCPLFHVSLSFSAPLFHLSLYFTSSLFYHSQSFPYPLFTFPYPFLLHSFTFPFPYPCLIHSSLIFPILP